jgi:ketosteroid isomerase-like protein
MRINLLALVLVCFAGCVKKDNQQFDDYDVALKMHLDAIQNHDLSSLLSTVHDSVTLIFPNGQLLKSKKEFADFHEGWFKANNWSLSPTIEKTIKSDSVSYSLVRYQYEDIDSAGIRSKPRSNYLLLVFKRDQGWKLIHDQNTRIATE